MSCWNGTFICGDESDVRMVRCGATMRLLTQTYDDQTMYFDRDDQVAAKVIFHHFSGRRMKIFEHAPFNYLEYQPRVTVTPRIVDEQQISELMDNFLLRLKKMTLHLEK